MTFDEWKATLPEDRIEIWGLKQTGDWDFVTMFHAGAIKCFGVYAGSSYEAAIEAAHHLEAEIRLPVFDFVGILQNGFVEVE